MNFDPALVLKFAATLNPDELDALKFQLSITAVSNLERTFDLPSEPKKSEDLVKTLQCLASIQPYSKHVPEYGIAYIGRPKFMSDKLLSEIQSESERYRSTARINGRQLISPVDTVDCSTACEKLESSLQLQAFVESVAGPCSPSYVSNYLYYDTEGHCSPPHVDNAFTSLTVMLSLEHDFPEGACASTGVSYWPGLPRFNYQLKPGEMSVFFGACALHGRTPVSKSENLRSLLLSFRPKLGHRA